MCCITTIIDYKYYNIHLCLLLVGSIKSMLLTIAQNSDYMETKNTNLTQYLNIR